MGRRRVFSILISTLLHGCFGEPNYGTISSMEASKVCMDGGGILDLGSGECQCPGGVPWDGSMCEGATPVGPVPSEGLLTDEKTPKDAVPEEHKAMYDTLPKDVKAAESKSEDPRLVGPPRLPSASVSTSTASVSTSTASVSTSTASVSTSTASIGTSTSRVTSAQTAAKANPSTTPTVTQVSTSTGVAKEASPSAPRATSPRNGKPSTDSATDQALAKVCRGAKGQWSPEDGTCQCPKGRSLVGQRCQKLRGRLSAVECLSAIHPGQWKKNRCTCPMGQEFSLDRGGCFPSSHQKQSPLGQVSRAMCENPRNNGKWDGQRQRCKCSNGRIWHKGQCRAQGNMTSRQVCVSDENAGTWDETRKTCACPAGSLWLDQRCQSVSSVSERAACESESNRGRWNSTSRTCQCPSRKAWSRTTKSCG